MTTDVIQTGVNLSRKRDKSAIAGKTAERNKSAVRSSAANEIIAPRLLLIASTVAMLVFGLVMVYSSSFVEAFTNPDMSDSAHIFKRQALLVVVGIAFMLITIAINYRVWNSPVSWLIWACVMAMLVATLLVGTEIKGGTRWLVVFGQQFQPSEFAKIALIMLVSTLVIRLRQAIHFSANVIAVAVAVGLPILLIIIQPDLGTTLIIFAGVIAVAWFGELSMKPLAIAGLLVMFIAAAGIMMAGFRMDRVDAWLDPFAFTSTTGYQIVNSFYAFAGGSVAGVGLGMSHQKYLYLPEAYNDMIFPIIGEEFGLIGTVAVVALFLIFMFASYRIARNAPDIYGRMLAGSAATLIGFQAFLNMLCMVNLFPMTGKPLPFFSAGGSSIIVTLILVGLILSVSFRSKVQDDAQKRRDELIILEGGRVQAGGSAYAALSRNSSSKSKSNSGSARSSQRSPAPGSQRSSVSISQRFPALDSQRSSASSSQRLSNRRSQRSSTPGSQRSLVSSSEQIAPKPVRAAVQSSSASPNLQLLSPARNARRQQRF